MKILTKEWAEKVDQIKLVHWLKDFDAHKTTYEDIEAKSKNDFLVEIAKDFGIAKACLDTNVASKLYQAKIARDRKILESLPKEICSKIKSFELLVLGYANKEDKSILSSYASDLLKIVEKDSERATLLTDIAENSLLEDFTLDEVVGELVHEEYSNEKDYFINIGGLIVCIENCQVIMREDFKINKWEENNPLTLWTAIEGAELHYGSDMCYELHLLLVDGDKYANEKRWYFTLKGTNVKFVKNYN